MHNSMSEDQVTSLWNKARQLGISRRKFLALLASGGAAAVLAALGQDVSLASPPAAGPSGAQTGAPTQAQVTPTPGTPAQAPAAPTRLTDQPTPKQFFRSVGGANDEMLFENMANREYAMPNSFFFIRDHTTVAFVDINNWKLSIEGDGVDKPFTLTYDELLKMPQTTVTRYVECAGNGRSFYDTLLKKPAQGGQWHLGAYGIAEWTGVKLSDLLNQAGVKSNAVEVMGTGLDSTHVARPMPIAKAMEPDTLLAYMMNGDILPTDHGFPARLIVPGYVGVNNIKWVGTITVSTKHLETEWNTKLYVLVGPDYQPQPPALGPAVNEQVMKSAIALPWPATLKAGSQKIVGYAWSPKGKIAKVDVSTDGGKTFQPATLVGPNIERAGTRWELTFNATPDMTTITPRATDETGAVQYDVSQQKWNQQGYIFGAMVPHPVKVEA